MNTTHVRPGRRLTLFGMMLAIGVLALAMAPLIEGFRYPSIGTFLFAVAVEVFVVPGLIAFLWFRSMAPGPRKEDLTAKFWIIAGLVYLPLSAILMLLLSWDIITWMFD